MLGDWPQECRRTVEMSIVGMTLAQLLEANAEKYGASVGYVDQTRSLTHGQYLDRAKRLAGGLYSKGARRQDRIAMLSMNSIEFLEVYGACEVSGLILAGVNYRLAPPEIKQVLIDAAPIALIFEAQYLSLIASLKQDLPSIQNFICVGAHTEWSQDYEDVIRNGKHEDLINRPGPQDIAHLMYTSGTTGKPKGCMQPHEAVLSKAQLHAGDMAITPEDRVLIVMPLFHVGARGITSAAQWRGAATYVLRKFDPDSYLRILASEKITVAHLAPTMVKDILDQESIANHDLSNLRVICYAAAPMPLPTLRKGLQLLGAVFHQSYGQTEGMVSSLLREQHRPDGTPAERLRLQSVGQPYPRTEVRIVDDAGADVPRGETGEIVYRGPVMFSGYWNDSVATFSTMRDGWITSGDIGKFDADGFLYIVDRKKDMIVSGGENILSREVEEALLTHAAVREAAVIGVPDDKWGESVHAFVVLEPGSALLEPELIEHCKQQIASYKKPRGITFSAELPRLVSGKINKVALRAAYKTSAST
jgi:acyl-CoA synthetase (AMP-forming)/AMP-acid ligase II